MKQELDSPKRTPKRGFVLKYYKLLYSAAELSEDRPSTLQSKQSPIDKVRGNIALLFAIIVLIIPVIMVLTIFNLHPNFLILFISLLVIGAPFYYIGLQLAKRVLASDTLIEQVLGYEEAKVESIREQKRIYSSFDSACSTILIMLMVGIGVLFST